MARGFNGTTQFLRRTEAIITVVPLSFSAWVNFSSNANGTVFSITSAVDDVNYLTGFYYQPTAEFWTYHSSAGVSWSAGALTVTTGVWVHVAGVFSSNSSRTTYVNGVAAAANTFACSNISGASRTSIGLLDRASPFGYFPGQIAELGIWSAALNAAEFKALSNGTTPPQIRATSLAGYWPLGGRYGQSDRDRWRNGYDMTAQNSPTWADHPRIVYPQPMGLPSRVVSAGGVAKPVLFHSYYMSQGMRP